VAIMTLEDLAGLDLNRLVVLAVLLKEGGVSPAARRLGRTQSAVSHTLAQLRRDLGDDLLVRVGRGMAPTPFAERLRSPLTSLLEQLGALTRGPAFDPATARRTFRVGWSDYLQLAVGGSWLSALRTAAPGIDLVAVAPPQGGPAPLLADGRLDLAFDVGLSDDDTLKGRLLFEDAFATLAGARGGFAPGPLGLEQFAAAPHLLVAPQGGPMGPVDRALARLGLRRRVALRLSHFLGVVDLIGASDLVTTLPRQLLLALGAPRERLLPPPLALPKLMVRVVWHERVHADPGVAWLRRTLIEHAGRRATSEHPAP
jgi:DNA-binding transcriptional LysR family regulator